MHISTLSIINFNACVLSSALISSNFKGIVESPPWNLFVISLRVISAFGWDFCSLRVSLYSLYFSYTLCQIGLVVLPSRSIVNFSLDKFFLLSP